VVGCGIAPGAWVAPLECCDNAMLATGSRVRNPLPGINVDGGSENCSWEAKQLVIPEKTVKIRSGTISDRKHGS